MMEELDKAKKALEQKKKEEKEMDLTFCKLIEDEINREKAKITDSKVSCFVRKTCLLFVNELDISMHSCSFCRLE